MWPLRENFRVFIVTHVFCLFFSSYFKCYFFLSLFPSLFSRSLFVYFAVFFHEILCLSRLFGQFVLVLHYKTCSDIWNKLPKQRKKILLVIVYNEYSKDIITLSLYRIKINKRSDQKLAFLQ